MNRSLLCGFVLGCSVTSAAYVLEGVPSKRNPLPRLATPAVPSPPQRIYDNVLTPLQAPQPLLADFPQFVEPVVELRRYEAPRLVDDPGGDLAVRAWRFSYNARGIIEMPNRLRASETAIIVVHPWAVDDGWGWKTPEPSGVVDFCTPEKNTLAYKHVKEVIDPFLKRLRKSLAVVAYSLPGRGDPIRTKVYRSFSNSPTANERAAGEKELRAQLASYAYKGARLPDKLMLNTDRLVIDYFKQFPGLDAGARFNGAGFWNLPIPVSTAITVEPEDVVIYDAEGYAPLREFLKKSGVRHVLLTGYATDMCFCKTTAGYQNLDTDFNVFLVGDATLATFPANSSPRFATNAHVSFAALDHLVTQANWVQLVK